MPRAKTKTIIKRIKKRDGRIVPFDIGKIERAIWLAAKAAGGANRQKAKYLAGLAVKELEKRFGVNVAGEGGEFESLVLDAPLFRKRLEIVDSKIVSEGECNHKLVVKKVKLVSKH